MGLLDVFRPRLRHPDPRVRLEAVAGLTDQSVLAAVARQDDSPRVRLAAVAKVEDDNLLAEIASQGNALDARLAAVERIASEAILAEIIRTRRNYELMCACFARITDRDLLQTIAQSTAYNPAARRMAVEQFADESYLADVARAAGLADTDGVTDLSGAAGAGGLAEASGARGSPPAAAGSDRKSDEAVEAILATYGDIRVVRALGRFRGSEKALKALGTIARKGGDVGCLAVEYLARALGSPNRQLRRAAADELACLRDAELVSALARSLDNPALCEPIREVLRRIGTPAAAAALDKSGDKP
jgi:hypothetical protein